MRRLVFLLTLCFVPAAAVEMQATSPTGVVVVLSDTSCVHPAVLALIQPEKHGLYQAGHWGFPAGIYEFCWRVSPDGSQIWVVDEQGDTAVIPITVFVPKEVI